MDPVPGNIIVICMAALFAGAVLHKLKAPAVFRAAMDEYQLIPAPLSSWVSGALMLAEVAAPVMVLVSVTRYAGLMLMASLLLVYALAISINLFRGRRDIDCGCGGPAIRQELSAGLVLRNLLLLILVLLAAEPSADRALNWLDLLAIVLGSAVASGLYLGANQLLAQAPRITSLRIST